MILAILLLISGLSISAVAEFYSIMGLMAIFSASPIPVAVMGISLGVGKLVIASWIKAYWERAPLLMKTYGVVAVAILMLITTLGCFGYLSKAHNDQNLLSGDVQSKIAIFDEKIKTARENIESDRKQLKQMDEAVDQIMGRSTDEKGADKANAVRKSQLKDRSLLAKDIEAQQKLIAKLNDEAAPIRAENRKVEAEVGPIRYIAAFIYGANPSENILEKAVTWVIILIVVVFDPLAVIMLLASQMTFQWNKEKAKPELTPAQEELYDETFPSITDLDTEVGEKPTAEELKPESEPIMCYKCGTELVNAPGIGPFCPNKECDVFDNTSNETIEFTADSILQAGVVNSNSNDNIPVSEVVEEAEIEEDDEIDEYVEEIPVADDIEPYGNDLYQHAMRTWKTANLNSSYIEHIDKLEAKEITKLPWEESEHIDKLNFSDRDIQNLKSDLVADNDGLVEEVNGFGIEFPKNPAKGTMFLKVDSSPNHLYKFNGSQWILVNKNLSDQYVYNDEYIDYLIEKIATGEYDPDLLNDFERERISEKLNETK